ncbi:MAG: hypothetical protein KAW83_05340 [Dehalococcoidia bacterium]|nr:hypothetical protein [Dehalococcoidia bacterium]
MVILSKYSVMKHVLASLLIALILLLPACSGSRSYYDHAPATSSPPPPPPPLNVTIDYIGVKLDHDPLEVQGPGDICLVIVITDGEHSIEEILPPGEGNAFYLNDYETITLNQRIFHTASAGDYLKISILAYEDDPEGLISDFLQVGLPILGVIMGNPDIGGLSTVLSQYEENTGKPLFENKDDYVGYYEEFWGSDESWGIGQHNAVGRDDFRVWLSVWSDSQPQPVPKPTLIPDVVIENVNMLSQVEVGKRHTTTITLRNNESHSITVTLEEHSSVTGDVSSQAVIVPANGNKDVTTTTHCDTPGSRTITYKVFFRGNEIASWQGTLVATTPSVAIQRVDMPKTVRIEETHTDIITLKNNQSSSVIVTLKGYSSVTNEIDSWQGTLVATTPSVVEELSANFGGWYVDGSRVNTTTKGKSVTARIALSGGDPGQYKLRVRRDILWASDKTVNELSFSYDGVSATKELSFNPPYAIDEASTVGYHVDLVKDGYTVWTLINSYPPRLRVSIP